jgi:hypothetical protein
LVLGEYGELLKGDGLLEGLAVGLLQGKVTWTTPRGSQECVIYRVYRLCSSRNTAVMRLFPLLITV